MQYRIIPVTAFEQNCSIVWCAETKQAAIIDPGGEPEKIKEAIANFGVTVTKILLTHGHLDHVGAARELADYYKVKVYGPQIEDKFLLDNLPHQSVQFGLSFCPSLEPDVWLNDDDVISIGLLNFDVVHCPGHTPGHIVFVNLPQQIAFVGDVLFKMSIGRTDFPRSNYADLMHSIKSKLLPLGDMITFVPGHGPLSLFGSEKLHNPYLK